ncbi:MAG: hypothetical protein II621_04485, partial [Clostridia bacterium]|nr:hypothetical protein [Clostridia bacterium]
FFISFFLSRERPAGVDFPLQKCYHEVRMNNRVNLPFLFCNIDSGPEFRAARAAVPAEDAKEETRWQTFRSSNVRAAAASWSLTRPDKR